MVPILTALTPNVNALQPTSIVLPFKSELWHIKNMNLSLNTEVRTSGILCGNRQNWANVHASFCCGLRITNP